MYISQHFAEHDQAEILRFIAAHAFGTLVTVDADVPFASHIPFLLEQGETLTLSGHLAKANPHYEGESETAWVPAYPDKMLEAIVGFEISIESLQAKYKLSQNRSAADQHNVMQALVHCQI